MDAKRGILIVVSGPSGSGKGTVLANVVSAPEFRYSVSATTRKPRPGEVDGVNYFFVTKERFLRMVENGELLEHARYVENYYGTPAEAVEKSLAQGINVILEIEVQGALQIKRKVPDCVMIMLIPPDIRTLERRLRERGTENEETIEERLEAAKDEFAYFDSYDYIVVNRDGEMCKAAAEIKAIALAESVKRSRMEYIKETFDTVEN